MKLSRLRTGGLALAAGALALAGPALAQAQRGGAFADLTTGAQIYKEVCQGCHMPDAKGAVGAGVYPPLAQNPKLAGAGYPIMVVTVGQKAMPEFGSTLSDAQIAEVVGYIRTNFGNRYRDKVAPADVTGMRPATGPTQALRAPG